MVKYAPLDGRGWQPLPEFLSIEEAIINIRNNDKRCFGYSILYFLKSENLPRQNLFRASVYHEVMFQHYHLDTIAYPISPNDVHLYEDQLQMNINLFSFFDDEGHARYPLVISRTNYDRVANLLYRKEHFAPITSIPRLFSDITKHGHEHQICLRCLGHFRTEESVACHK